MVVVTPTVVPTRLDDEDVHVLFHDEAPLGAFGEEVGRGGDERMAPGRTVCSEHLLVRPTPATAPKGGWVYASPEANARRGGGGGEGDHLAWVDVVPAAGLEAVIGDPSALAACCATQADACTGWFVDRVFVGSGTFHHPTGGANWAAGTSFTGVPYAFSMGSNPYATPDCGAWQLELPRAADGIYALGVSNATFAERTATADATARLRESAIAGLRAAGASDALVEQMREERWCIDAFPGAGGEQFIAQVLAYIPLPKAAP